MVRYGYHLNRLDYLRKFKGRWFNFVKVISRFQFYNFRNVKTLELDAASNLDTLKSLKIRLKYLYSKHFNHKKAPLICKCCSNPFQTHIIKGSPLMFSKHYLL